MLSGTIRWATLEIKRPTVLIFPSRDGDVVAIRASADGGDLVIGDLALDTSAPSKSAVEVAALDL